MGIQQALVTVTGNLGAVPNPFTTSANVPACSFRMGVTRVSSTRAPGSGVTAAPHG